MQSGYPPLALTEDQTSSQDARERSSGREWSGDHVALSTRCMRSALHVSPHLIGTNPEVTNMTAILQMWRLRLPRSEVACLR